MHTSFTTLNHTNAMRHTVRSYEPEPNTHTTACSVTRDVNVCIEYSADSAMHA